MIAAGDAGASDRASPLNSGCSADGRKRPEHGDHAMTVTLSHDFGVVIRKSSMTRIGLPRERLLSLMEAGRPSAED
jgi:hypothetical protein